jgi:hypothetical protein
MRKALSGILTSLFFSAALFGVVSSVYWVLSGLGLAVLFSLPTAYAEDCSISFDQSCLSSPYNRRQVERDHQVREESIDGIVRAQKEKAIKEAQQEEKRFSEAIEERRHQERLKAYKDVDAAMERRHQERLKAIDNLNRNNRRYRYR